MIANDNDTDQALMMLTCLKQNAENINRECKIMHRQHLEALEEHRADLHLLEELSSMDRKHEFRTMFFQLSEAVGKSEERNARIRELEFQFDQTRITFIRICVSVPNDPTIESILREFCDTLASFNNPYEDPDQAGM